nr:M23 family metallopeptidase [Nocardioides perillae]
MGASAAVASQPNDILTAARPASDSFSPAAQVDTADARAALLDRASGVSRSQQRAADDAVQEATEIARARQTALRSLAQRAVARSTYLTENRWVLPMTGYRITATFGQSSYLWSTVHTGVDLAAATGVPIATVGAGEVVSAGYDGSYGNKVVVRHDDGTETWYAHMDSIGVTTGQQVEAGQGVGTVGSTGNVTGPHLHLEFRPGGGAPVDPQTALAALGVLL